MKNLARLTVHFVAIMIVWLVGNQIAFAQTPSLLHQWRAHRSNFSESTLRSSAGQTAKTNRPPVFDDETLLEFEDSQYLVVQDGEQNLPSGSFSAEAWVRVDQATRWGCILGFQQDNGNYEKGWSLGYNNDRFEFRVSNGDRLVNATASAPMQLGQWHHVVGICDAEGQELRLYVDGQQQNQIKFAANGPVYPTADLETELVIGAYKDKNELHVMRGRLREVRLYGGVLNEELVQAHVQWQDRLPEQPLRFSVRPGVRFLTPTSAEVRWETTVAGKSALAFGPTRKSLKIVVSDASGTSHSVVMNDLLPGQDYVYRFGLNRDGKRSFSPFYQLEGSMNYSPPVVVTPEDRVPSASEVIDELEQQGGYAVVLGSVDPEWANSIAAGTTMTVVAAVHDESVVNDLRKQWYSDSDYGIRLSAQLAKDVPDTIANLVVANTGDLGEAERLRSPLGVLVAIGSKPKLNQFRWTNLGDSVWMGRIAQAPELAAWGHQYGSTENASFSGEMLGGVDNTADLRMKWIGRPGADFGIDRNPRMPAPLAVGGRLFHQGMNRMIALDAFNGAVLWSLEIPDLRRVNIPRDSANWCADETHVYAAVKDRLWVIDAASGEMQRTLLLPEQREQGFEWGYVAITDDTVLGTAMKQGSGYSGFWDKASWYDGKGDAATAKVCGNAIVAYDKKYGSINWQRSADAIVHSTIAVSGEHVFFVEVADPNLKNESSGKLTNDKIWSNASVVCININTGEEVWKSKVPPQNHETIISFGLADNGQYVLQTSGKNHFHFVSLGADDGQPQWKQSVAWPEDHHGAHAQHAVLMNGRIYVQPHILDASDGSIVKSGTLGKRRGCATPIGAGNSIIYRGGSGPLTLWSLDDDKPSEFTRLRPSCWLSTIPAQGMLFSPEGGGGCSCGGWMETSVGFAPIKQQEDVR